MPRLSVREMLCCGVGHYYKHHSQCPDQSPKGCCSPAGINTNQHCPTMQTMDSVNKRTWAHPSAQNSSGALFLGAEGFPNIPVPILPPGLLSSQQCPLLHRGCAGLGEGRTQGGIPRGLFPLSSLSSARVCWRHAVRSMRDNNFPGSAVR